MDENLLNEPVYAHDDGPNQDPPGSVIGYVDHVYSVGGERAVIQLRSSQTPTKDTKYEDHIGVLICDGILGGINSKWVELDA